MTSLVNKFSKESHTTSGTDQKVESKLNVRDLEALHEAFSYEGKGYGNKLRLNKEQFIEALSLILNRGTRQEYNELFDKVDITGDGYVDWDKFASHLILEFNEREDKLKTLSVPQWKDLKTLNSPHKDTIQKVAFIKNLSRYLTVSKEGLATLWGLDLKPQRTAKAITEACRPRDLWVTDFALMPNISKVALAFTSKEIAFCNIGIKLDLYCPVKLYDLHHTPICLSYWSKPDNPNEALLAWGDIGGFLNVLFWSQAAITLFEKPSTLVVEKEETTFNVSLNDIIQKKSKVSNYLRFRVHSDWVRQVTYIPQLEAFITCATVWNSSMVISWLEKLPVGGAAVRSPNASNETRFISRSSVFAVHQGINAFDYHEGHNQIATAGVNYHVCLWNPYVVSKPNGLLRGHMAAVIAVQFHRSRGRLLSLSRDRVLRIWDVQSQVCIQRINGVFPKGLEEEPTSSRKQTTVHMFFHEDKLRLFLSFNYVLTMMEMKIKVRDRVYSHEKPIVGVIFSSSFNQIVSACQGGTISFWLVETGQRVKNISRSHNDAELTCLVQHPTESKFYTGSTDGTIKIWDMNGYCHHTLICFGGAHSEVGQIVILKRAVIVMGNSNHFTVFRTTNFRDHYVYPSEWKGGPEHLDDVLSGVALPPNGLITGSYDGEIVVWNTNSELAARRMTQRCKRMCDNSPDFMYNVSRLILLTTRKHISSGIQKGANLVSCGGNGIVRFWNAYSSILVGEFIAHQKASNIIMSIDSTNEYLATGDIDGVVKVWNIKQYCLIEGEMEVNYPPELLSQWNAHIDLISGICFCSRMENRIFIITSSTDCSVILWTLDGTKIGVVGQETRWKLENVNREIGVASVASTETAAAHISSEGGDLLLDEKLKDERQSSIISHESSLPRFVVDNIEPFEGDFTPYEVSTILAEYRVNSWEHTLLGKEYQEVRLRKRQRKQPHLMNDLYYLYGERTGRPNYGPYYSLQISAFDPVEELEQPDFMEHPENYFADREEFTPVTGGKTSAKSPEQTCSLRNQKNTSNLPSIKNHFNEQSFFPNYILNLDQQIHRVNKFVTSHNSTNCTTDHHSSSESSKQLGEHENNKKWHKSTHISKLPAINTHNSKQTLNR